MSLSHEIQRVAWAEMQAHFMHTFAYGLAISEMAIFHAIYPHLYARSRLAISQPCEPAVEDIRCPDIHHHRYVSHGIQIFC